MQVDNALVVENFGDGIVCRAVIFGLKVATNSVHAALNASEPDAAMGSASHRSITAEAR